MRLYSIEWGGFSMPWRRAWGQAESTFFLLLEVPGVLIGQLLADTDQRTLGNDSGQLSSTPQADTLDTTIRDHDNLDLGKTLLGQTAVHLEEVLTMRGHGSLLQQDDWDIRSLLVSLNGDSLGRVTHVVSSVDFDIRNVAGLSELDGGEINVTWAARALGLPTVRHVVSTSRKEHVGGVTIVSVGEVDNDRSCGDGGQVVDLVLVLGVDLVDRSVDAETGDTAIGVHAEANVGVVLSGGLVKLESVERARVEGNLGQNRSPLDCSPLLMSAGSSLGRCSLGVTLDGDEGSVVASEVRSVDLETCNGTGVSELDDAPVKVGGVVAAGLPAIVPCAGGNEASWSVDWSSGSQKVLALGEPFVGEGQDFASTGNDSEVW